MEKLLLDAMALNCKFIMQYVDYPEGTWTTPLFLSKDRIKKMLDDVSVKEVRIIITPGY